MGLLKILSGLVGVIAASTINFGQPAPTSFALVGVTVVDVAASRNDQALRRDQIVVVRGPLIVAVGDAKDVRIPADAQRIDGRGKYLIPGLWDMHAHMIEDDRLDYYPTLFIVNGVTGIRDLGSRLPLARNRAVRAAIAEGAMTGPRIGAVAGSILEGPRGPATRQFQTIATATEGRQAVIEHKQEGADFIKVYNMLARDVYFAIVDEARRQQLPVAGHIPMSITAAEASDAGQKSIEHSGGMTIPPAELLISCSRDESTLRKELLPAKEYAGPPETAPAFGEPLFATVERRAAETYDSQKAAELFSRFVRNRTWQVPTLVLDRPMVVGQSELEADSRLKYLRASVRERWRVAVQGRRKNSGDLAVWKPRVQGRLRLIGEMHRAGVPMLAGTDANNPYVVAGFSLHDELALLVEAGLTPLDALRTATLNPARFLGQVESLGTIEGGKFADLVLVGANPLQDITNTQRIDAVVFNGRYLPRRALDMMLADVERIVSRDAQP